MKKIFESELVGFDESAEQVTVYELESEEERQELDEMQHSELCELFNVYDDFGYCVLPGAIYHHYDFDIKGSFLIMTDYSAYNI